MGADRGPGAVLGPFQGEVTGVDATAAYNFKIGHMPAPLRARAYTEFNATNRMEGDSLWLGLTVPPSLKMPAGAPHWGASAVPSRRSSWRPPPAPRRGPRAGPWRRRPCA